MWLTTAVAATGLFLAVVSTTMVSVALPTIGRDLGANTTDLEMDRGQLTVLVYASLLITGGVVGDHLGHKGMFVLGVAAFGLGSLVTGVAPTVGVLLADAFCKASARRWSCPEASPSSGPRSPTGGSGQWRSACGRRRRAWPWQSAPRSVASSWRTSVGAGCSG